ncbi:hypothetical protein D3C86_1825190 [compost metagenome]
MQQFKRLTITPAAIVGAVLTIEVNERVTLTVFDRATARHWLLTLEPKELLMSRQNTYRVLMKSAAGEWQTHDDFSARPATNADLEGGLVLLNLGVIRAVPA